MAINWRQPTWTRTRAILTGLALLACFVPACKPKPPSYTIGVVNFVPAMQPAYDAFKVQMEVLGYREGGNTTYIYDGPVQSFDLLDAEVQKLLAADVDLILSLSTPAAQAAARGTTQNKTPVVFVPVTDPVGAGIVADLRQPGGNVTGITNGGSDGRRLEWLLRAAPGVRRVYVPYNPNDASPVSALAGVSEAAKKLGVELVPFPAANAAEMTAALENIPEDIDAVFMLPDVVAIALIDEFVKGTYARQLPLSVPTTGQVEDGALISFGLDFAKGGTQAARLADQILRGTEAGDLPVETGEFTLAINLVTANRIGLVVPDDVVAEADTIIPFP